MAILCHEITGNSDETCHGDVLLWFKIQGCTLLPHIHALPLCLISHQIHFIITKNRTCPILPVGELRQILARLAAEFLL